MKPTSACINSGRSTAFTKALLPTLAVVLLVLLANVAYAQEAYLPLAGAKVFLREAESDDFVQAIERYADAGHYKLGRAVIPKRGRMVVVLGVHISDKTHFTATNFRDADTFELTAYSHEEAGVWKNPWNALISSLSSRFGDGNVTPWTPH